MDDAYTGSGQTLTAFFDSRAEADKAIVALREAGIPEANIRYAEGIAEAEREPRQKGFFEALSDLFLPDSDRYAYAEGLARGGFLVTVVDVPPHLRSGALDVLDAEGAIDFDEREASWRAQGWPGYGEEPTGAEEQPTRTMVEPQPKGFAKPHTEFFGGGAAGAAPGTGAYDVGGNDVRMSDVEQTVPVAEERLRVGRRDVNLGRVRVRSYVREEPVTTDVELQRERVEVERWEVDRPVEPGESAFEERVIEAEEHTEEPVITKEARIVEEVGLRRERESRTETVNDTVRRTEVDVEDERTPERPRSDRNS
jgi:stress response protein YsnF